MARVFDFTQYPRRKPLVRVQPRRPLSARDSANLLTAVALMDEARTQFTAFVHNTHNPALRELFAFLAWTMGTCAKAIRDKIAGRGQGDDPRRD